jgi:RNA polymerase sigma factor (sigma-70 family)
VRRRLGPALRRKDESGDYVQDAVVEFLRYAPRFHMSSDSRFRALLGRIIENVLRDRNDWFTAQRRAMSKERPLPRDTVLNLDPPRQAAESPSQVALQHEQEAWVRLGLEFLDSEDRRLIVFREWEGLTFSAMGERLGISLSAVRDRYLRAVDRLTDEVWALRTGGKSS